MDNRKTLMMVHAHPDDEVLATGGALAKAAAEGMHTVLVCATRGEEGEIHDPDLDPEEARARLGEIRERELRAACDILGVGELHFLGYRDSGMANTPANANPENFYNADPEEVAQRLVRLIRETRPQVVVTYDERGGYGHPDHIAAHLATVAAVEAAADPSRFREQGRQPWQVSKLYYAVFSRSMWQRFRQAMIERGLPIPWESEAETESIDDTVPDEDITTWIDVREYLDKKDAAIRVHRTQIPQDNPLMRLPPEIAQEFFGWEHYKLVQANGVTVNRPESDLFAGLD